MSAIASAWVATIKVGNQTAKQLLQFYASHNFNKPGFEFKNETLASQLEVKVRSIQYAHKLLIEKGYLKKEERFAKDGSQLTSLYYLNIPQSFIDKFFGGGEGAINASPGCNKDTPRGAINASLNNNINNNKNKRERTRKKREPLPDNFILNKENSQRCKERSINEVPFLIKFKLKQKGKLNSDWQNEAKIWIETENVHKFSEKIEPVRPKYRDMTQERIDREIAEEKMRNKINEERCCQ